MICKALIAVTASMIYDGDTVSIPGPEPSVRLESMDFEFDTPEIGRHAGCSRELEMGMAARDFVRSKMPGHVCIVERGGGSWGRDVGVLFDTDLQDVGPQLVRRGLARVGRTADWCE